MSRKGKKIERLKLDLSLNFKKEPPKSEKGGEGVINPIYEQQVRAFIESDKDWASVEGVPKDKIITVSAGLKSAIKRLGKEEDVKPIIRKDSLYLITRKYSEDQKWKWTRKK